jgi:PIN domain nuclease of toxin-antitoxin system
MTSVLLDTHALLWWLVAPGRLSNAASSIIEQADELVVSGITWWELAWLARNGRISLQLPLRTWLSDVSRGVRTAPVTPLIAASAAELPDAFPGDPADRLIYATALEHGWRLVSKDGRLHAHDADGTVVTW